MNEIEQGVSMDDKRIEILRKALQEILDLSQQTEMTFEVQSFQAVKIAMKALQETDPK